MTPRWQRVIPGASAHRFVFEKTSVLVSDGWGCAFRNLALRRLRLRDGQELASVRLGDQVRCVTPAGPGGLLAATDKRLHRLDPRSLVEAQRWERRIPRYTDHLLVHGDHALGCNHRRGGLASIALATGRVTTRRASMHLALFALGDDQVLVTAQDGRLWRCDHALTTSPVPLGRVDPFTAVALQGRTLHTAAGRVLCCRPLSALDQVTRTRLPAEVAELAVRTGKLVIALANHRVMTLGGKPRALPAGWLLGALGPGIVLLSRALAPDQAELACLDLP